MMVTFIPPVFCKEFACIAEDAALAATLSSLVGEEGEYVSVLEGPRMGRHDPESEVIRRCNGIAKVWPRTLLLAGLSSEAVAGITSTLPPRVTVLEIQTKVDVFAATGAGRQSGLAGEIRCRLTEIGTGLLLAKREKKVVIVDESSPPLPRPSSTLADHVVVLDDHDSVAQVIAANYAYSIGADLILLPQREDTLRDQVYVDIDARGAYKGEKRGMRAVACLQTLRSLLEPTLRFGPREFATFITRGIPYGYFYRDAPSTHLFSYPNLGEVINAGIYWATTKPFAAAAVLIDPGHFTSSETPAVSASLKADGVSVIEVLDDQADVENTRLFFEAFPYDLLFICSHCGEVGGERLTIRVSGADGTIYTIVVDEVVQFGSTKYGSRPGQEVQVHQLMCPISIDGADWHSPGGTKLRREAGVSLLRPLHEERDVVCREKVARVSHSTAIKLRQGMLLLNLQQVIDPSVSPIIFNNGCVSFYDAAATLTFAGARAYIGTLAPVETSAAQRVAETVFGDRLRAESLPKALAKAQEQVFPTADDRTYVHVGCHFTAIRPPPAPADRIVKRRILEARNAWERQLRDADVRRQENIMEVIRFLSAQLQDA